MSVQNQEMTPRGDVRRSAPAVVWGVVLLLAGFVLLLDYLGLIPDEGVFWAGAFALAGAAFLTVFAVRPESWWAAIPAGALLGLAIVTAWGEIVPGADDDRTGAVFLGLLGAGFWAVWLRSPHRWWAIIPGGVLLTLAVTAVLTGVTDGAVIGAVFFFGLSVTFLLLTVLSAHRMRWPLIPAAALALIGLLTALEAVAALEVLNYLWPVALIAAGVFVLWRNLVPRRQSVPRELLLHGAGDPGIDQRPEQPEEQTGRSVARPPKDQLDRSGPGRPR